MKTDQLPLFRNAEQAQLEPRVLSSGDGALLLTVTGARILGVFLEGDDSNLLWTNPALTGNAATARRAVRAGEWNLGGERCWISPEIELFFEHPSTPHGDEYEVPADIDPGNYEIDRELGDGVNFVSSGTFLNRRTGIEVPFHLMRGISLCAAPVDTEGLRYIGYEISSALSIVAADEPTSSYGLWFITQIPAGGTLAFAVREKADLIDIYDSGVGDRCSCTDDCVFFPLRGDGRHKLGISSANATGRYAYLRPAENGAATLIVRQSAVFPGGLYADFPGNDRERRDVAVQAYADDGDLGDYGEMECHALAACAANGFFARDVSRVWCFAGPQERLQSIAERLLGCRWE